MANKRAKINVFSTTHLLAHAYPVAYVKKKKKKSVGFTGCVHTNKGFKIIKIIKIIIAN